MTTEDAPIRLCVPVLRGSGKTRAVLGLLDDGRTALYAYTSEEKLVECCGDDRNWISADMARVDRLVLASGGCDVVMLDAVLSEELRRVFDDVDDEPESFMPASWLSSPSER